MKIIAVRGVSGVLFEVFWNLPQPNQIGAYYRLVTFTCSTYSMSFDKLLTLIIGVVFMIVLSCDGPSSTETSEAQTPAKTNALKPLLQDPVFWDYAASSNMLQTELGQLAVEKGTTAEMRERGEHIMNFHGQALEQIKQLVAGQERINLPDSLGSADRELVNELRELQGEEFSNRYRDFVLNTHKLQLERYREVLDRANSSEVEKWLQTMLLHLQKELDSFSKLDSTLSE